MISWNNFATNVLWRVLPESECFTAVYKQPRKLQIPCIHSAMHMEKSTVLAWDPIADEALQIFSAVAELYLLMCVLSIFQAPCRHRLSICSCSLFLFFFKSVTEMLLRKYGKKYKKIETLF